jgi:RNA polymerase sigma factor (sigma-70 family)
VVAPAFRLLSDERLAGLAAAGDRAAFGVIFDRHHQELFRYCVSLTRNPDDAADALQSTMLRALRALEGETRRIAVRPWLYRIAHNECMTVLRSRPQAGEAAETTASGSWDVEASAEARAQLDQLLGDIRQLPERQRGALVMRELGGLPYGEIAAALETSPAAAKQAIYDARRTLYELAKGRDMECDRVRRMLSDGDGRAVRARSIRAHLRACEDCRGFRSVTVARKSALASLVPGMPAGAAAQIMRTVVAGGASGAGGATAGLGGGGVVASLAAPLVVKSAAALVAAAAVGAGTMEVVGARSPEPPVRPKLTAPAPSSQPASHAGPSTRPAGAPASGPGSRGGPSTRPERGTKSRRSRGTDRGETQSRSAQPSGSAQGTTPSSSPSGTIAPAPSRILRPRQPRPGRGGGGSVTGVVPPAVGQVAPQVEDTVDGVRGTVDSTVGPVTERLPVDLPRLPKPRIR